MDQTTHNKKVSFIWCIAADVLRDLFKRGKYPAVILPMCVIRRMDAVLAPAQPKVLDTRKMLDEAHITEQRVALCDAVGQAFYDASKFTLRDLKSHGSQQPLFAADLKQILNAVSWRVETTPPVIAKVHKPGKAKAEPLRTLVEIGADILAIKKESEGLLDDLLKGGKA